MTSDMIPRSITRARRGAALIVALSVFGYLGYALWSGLPSTVDALTTFRWSLALPVLGLTLVNYGLRFVKWTYLLTRVGVRVPLHTNLLVFTSGLAMVITPAKAGELLKPWMIKATTGDPLTRTLPVLVAERTTDGIAVLILAAIGATTYYEHHTRTLLLTLGILASGLVVLSNDRLSFGLLRAVAPLPGIRRMADRLEQMLVALKTCLAPGPLALTLAISVVAWWAECIGLWLVFEGLDVKASLDLSTSLYAFATLFGAPSPGGVGIADAALAEGAVALIPGIPHGTALAAALLIRIATLWFGVVLGALAIPILERVLPSSSSSQEH